jgi:LysM repeat protein
MNSPSSTPKTASKRLGSYKVKRGDTLSDIAKANGTTVKALLAANKNIKDMNKIGVGQSINMGAAAPNRKSVYEGLSSLKDRGEGSPSVEKTPAYSSADNSASSTRKTARERLETRPSSYDNNDVEYKHGGSLTKRSSGGRVGVGAAQRGYGAVRSK